MTKASGNPLQSSGTESPEGCEEIIRIMHRHTLPRRLTLGHDFIIVNIPININPMPAAMDKYFGLTISEIIPPAATPIADVTISAADEAIKTTSLLTYLSEA